MYPYSLYLAFKQLRKQMYKCRTGSGYNRYSEIERYIGEFRTYQRFYEHCREHLSEMYRDGCTDKTAQEIFDDMLEKTQKRTLKYSVDWLYIHF